MPGDLLASQLQRRSPRRRGRSVLLGGDEEGIGLVILGLDAVCHVVLLEVEQAVCTEGIMSGTLLKMHGIAAECKSGLQNVRTEKIEELLLAQMHPVLEYSRGDNAQ
jgi:hypothetical protein